MATEKQVNYTLSLLKKAGYPTNNMTAEYKLLGASMKERSGKVRDWLAAMEKHTISKLIDNLK